MMGAMWQGTTNVPRRHRASPYDLRYGSSIFYAMQMKMPDGQMDRQQVGGGRLALTRTAEVEGVTLIGTRRIRDWKVEIVVPGLRKTAVKRI